MFRSLTLIPLALLLAACASSQPAAPSVAQPTSVASTATSAPAAPPAAATPAPAASPAATGAPVTTQVRFSIAQPTEARFRAREQLAQRSAPNDAVGKTTQVTGNVVIGPNNAVVKDQSKITVNLASLQSDSSQRDNFIKSSTLETNRYPNAEFIVTELRGLTGIPTNGEVTFDMVGDMTIHGVTKQAVWKTTATFSAQSVKGLATVQLRFADYGMTAPRVPVVLSIEEPITLELDFTANRATAVN